MRQFGRGGLGFQQLKDAQANRVQMNQNEAARSAGGDPQDLGVPLRVFDTNDAMRSSDQALAFSGAVAASLTLANVSPGNCRMIPISNRSGVTLTILPINSLQKVNGATSATLAAGAGGLLFSDGGGWKLVT